MQRCVGRERKTSDPGVMNERSFASFSAARNGMRVKLVTRDDEPAGGLRHRLDEQHARHQRIAGKVSLEDRSMWSGRVASARMVCCARSSSAMRSMS